MPRKIPTNFSFQVFFKKCNFQCAFDDNVSATYVFIKQILRAAEKATPYLPPPHCALCRGGGSTGTFQPKAVALVMVLIRED
jgi:hypothetical protein